MKPTLSAAFALLTMVPPALLASPFSSRRALPVAPASLTIPLHTDATLIGTPASAVAAVQEKEATWSTDYSAALEQAKAQHKLVLLNFTGSDWCGWCHKLSADVFDRPEFKRLAPARFVLVTLDFPRRKKLPAGEAVQNARLRREFNVRGYPTIIVVEANGTKVAEITGYVRGGPKGFFAALDRQLQR